MDVSDVEAVVRLGDLSLRFGQVDRITYHPDGQTLESDTDHTVMLGLICCAFADKYFLDLNLGLVAKFCLVHDLPEVYAGDTPTLRITAEEYAAKKFRETSARQHISKTYKTSLPWVPETIDWYEAQNTREARYVKAMDKLLPKITHILNSGVTIKNSGLSRDELLRRYDEQLVELCEYASDFPELFQLRVQLIEIMIPILDRAGVWDNATTAPRVENSIAVGDSRRMPS